VESHSLNETKVCILLDAAIYAWRFDGQTAVEKFFARNPQPEGTMEHEVAQAMLASRHQVVMVVEPFPPDTLRVSDLMSGESHLLADRSMSVTAKPGLILLSRLLYFRDFSTTTGAAMVVGDDTQGDYAAGRQWIRDLVGVRLAAESVEEKTPSVEQESEWTLSVVARGLQLGLADHIAFHEP